MVQDKNLSVVEKFKRKLSKSLLIDKLVLFGSRAKHTFNEESDFDLLVVSKDFEGVPLHLRSRKPYAKWLDERPVEFLCFTPNEIKRKLESPVRGVIAEAIETGIVI